ncbi:MAG: SdiA-regulated domain-containing protein [Oligoflexales bacterium]
MRIEKILSFIFLIESLAATSCKSRESQTMGGGNGNGGGNGGPEEVKLRDLDTVGTVNIPLEEVSGSCVTSDHGGERMYFIGDRSYGVASYDPGNQSTGEVIDLSGAFPSSQPSQWEAISCSNSGMAYILNESPGNLYVVNLKTQKLVKTIEFATVNGMPKTWNKSENSKGEGILILNNGHIFVLKEKDVPLLIEYGPEGDSAQGLDADLAPYIVQGNPFSNKKKETYVPLHEWEFNDQALSNMKDFSEITRDPEGRVYILSQESQLVGKIEGKLRTDEGKVDIRKFYKLPKSIPNPEGLSVLGGFNLVVSSDIPSDNKDNVFILTAADD